MNVADAASKMEGLERLVVSALCHAEEGSKGKYKNVKHWDGKAEGVRYLKEMYPDLEKKTSVVVVGNYMENWITDIKLRKVCRRPILWYNWFCRVCTDESLCDRLEMDLIAWGSSDLDSLSNHI